MIAGSAPKRPCSIAGGGIVGKSLRIENVGPIAKADISFEDLTVLVGPQATGKSITLQLLKLLVDTGSIHQQLQSYGVDWSGDLAQFLTAYFGEGMASLWKADSSIRWDGANVDLATKARGARRSNEENLFYIPAQRVIAMREGWPRPFGDYRAGDPYAVRQFSEQLRLLMEREFGEDNLFPRSKRLKKELRDGLKAHIFGEFGLQVDSSRIQKRLVLDVPETHEQLPYMVWSAGQREFVPMLLGFYWLMPSVRIAKRENLDWVVVEEPEMGLHPSAISVVLFMILELLKRGYRVILSTHSPQVVELVWVIETLRRAKATSGDLLAVFGMGKNPETHKVAQAGLKAKTSVHFFDRTTGCVTDISGLDPFSEDARVSGWGGLVDFSGRANAVVADVLGR